MKDTELRDEMIRRFSLSELRTVCFDAGIPYENLGDHQTVSGLALSVIRYIQRRGGEKKLFWALTKNNPAFKLVGDGIEVEEPVADEDEIPTRPLPNLGNAERDAIIEVLESQPNLPSIAGALIWIMKRL